MIQSFVRQYRVEDIGPMTLIAMLYWQLALFTSESISSDGIISLFNPAAGLAIAMLLLKGAKYWPAVFVGACLVFFNKPIPIYTSLGLAASSVMTALAAYWLLNRTKPLDLNLSTTKDFLKLWGIGGFGASLIGSLLAAFVLLTAGASIKTDFYTNLELWWRGDVIGILLVTPLLLIWRTPPEGWFSHDRRKLEFVILLGVTFLVGQSVFLDWFSPLVVHINLDYWSFALISIAAIRFGRHGALLVLSLTAIQALVGVVLGVGLFGDDIIDTQLFNFWIYIQIVAMVGMAQAIIIEDNQVQASFDALTGLPNRRLFLSRLKQEQALAQRNDHHLALMFIDLDRFKEVNDTLGHATGDKLLYKAAQRLKHCVRESDTVARVGGDEFTIIVTNIRDFADMDRIANAVVNTMRRPFNLGGHNVYVSASVGVTLYPDDSKKTEDLLRFADQAMYTAKANGRDNFHYFTPSMQEQAVSRSYLAHDLRLALESDQLSLLYQPIVDTKTGHIVKAEALIRWNHPTRGMVYPDTFIKVAEETGYINEIGEWVFRRVLQQVAHWRAKAGLDFQVSFNMSPVQFLCNTKNAWMLDHIQSLGLPADAVAIEITEGVLLDDRSEVASELKRFYDNKIEIAIDDFGTGYSSLSYLRRYPMTYLKIDRTFTSDVTNNENTRALVLAIVSMAHALNLKVIAEGIETPEQHHFMVKVGCDYVQGYLYSKPLTVSSFEALLNRENRWQYPTNAR